MTNITYKGKEIVFNEGDERFYVRGGDKSFSSVATAKKAIDKAVPEKAFVPFQVVLFDGPDTYDAPEAPRVIDIIGSERSRSRRSYERNVLYFLVKDGEKEYKINPRYGRANLFPLEKLDELMAVYEKSKSLFEEKERIEKKREALADTIKEFAVEIRNESLDKGNEEPEAI